MRNNELITGELKQMSLLMHYDRSKTLSEQFFGPTAMLKSITRVAEPGEVFEYDKGYWFESSNWNHSKSAWAEIGLTVAGAALLLTPLAPLGGAMIFTATAIGVRDALVYFDEDDPYMGTMMLALQLIPGNELLTIFRKSGGIVTDLAPNVVKFVENATPEMLTKIVRLGTEGGAKLNDFQKKVYQFLGEGFSASVPLVVKNLSSKSIKLIRKTVIGVGLIKSLSAMMKAGKWVGTTILKVGGVSVTVDQLWTLINIFHTKEWSDKMRTKSEFSKIMDMLYDGRLTTVMKESLWLLWKRIVKGEDLTEDVFDDNLDYEEINKTLADFADEGVENYKNDLLTIIDNRNAQVFDELDKNELNNKPVTLNSIMDGKKIIQKGAKGDVVRSIQTMLVSLGYELGTTGKLKNGVDGEYGDTMEGVIWDFQMDNNLEGFDGKIGGETVTKLKKLYDEK